MIEPEHISVPIGNIQLVEHQHKTAFLCSRGMTDAGRPAIEAWIDSLNPNQDCIMCGNIQRIEIDVLNELVKKRIPVVLVFDGPFPPMWPLDLVSAIGDQRLLALTTADFLISWVDKFGMADARNKYMIANSEKVVLGLCRPGGQLSKQLEGMDVQIVELNPYSQKFVKDHDDGRQH